MKKIKGHDQLWVFFSIQAVTHADVESGFQWKSGDSCVSSSMHSHLTEAHLLKATVLSRVSHRIVLVSDAAASQLHGKSKNTTSCTKSHHRCKQWGKMGHTHTHTQSWQAAVTTEQNKRQRVLHVFGVRGNRGVLDLSRFASQNFRFVSEDLEIKSNTPQVGKTQEAAPTQRIRVELRGKQVDDSKRLNLWYRMCMSCDTS